LSEIVFRHGGTIDKFIGDCVMAVWGAPIASDDHAHRALQAAEDMLRFLENANPSWQEKYGMTIRLGIGVNTGAAIVGNVGSDKRMEYTVIGDTVNVAARLEGIAGPDQVLVGEATYARVGDDFEFEAIGERTLTGRSAPSQIYSLRT
jgi:adenylate cyclase